MGQSAVVESQIADAISLVKNLDKTGAAPTLAMWYFYDDAGEWRLVLAGPTFDALLPKQEAVAYRRLAEAMASLSLSSLSLSDLKLVTTKSPLVQAIRLLVGTPPDGVVRAHFSDTTLNGIFIKEMIVIRSASPRA